MSESYHQYSGRNLGRVQGLADGVFAVATTLLVLDLRLPGGAGSDHELWSQLNDLGPSLTAYLLSFTMLGTFWLALPAVLDLSLVRRRLVLAQAATPLRRWSRSSARWRASWRTGWCSCSSSSRRRPRSAPDHLWEVARRGGSARLAGELGSSDVAPVTRGGRWGGLPCEPADDGETSPSRVLEEKTRSMGHRVSGGARRE